MRELGDGIWQLEATGRFTGVYLVAADELVLVDAGTPGRAARLAQELEAAGRRPALIVLTHGDTDHTGGANELRRRFQVEVWAPAAERALLEHRLRGRGVLPTLTRVLTRAQPATVDRWFEPGDVVAGLQVIATPGHTPGHVSFRRGDLLIAGDAVQTGERFRVPRRFLNVDHERALRSVAELADLEGLDLAVSGHGAPARDATTKLRRLASEVRR
jgi:glyoxylase-like metal-dependent hydrolase (beta-lactamase superfamily II)